MAVNMAGFKIQNTVFGPLLVVVSSEGKLKSGFGFGFWDFCIPNYR